MNGKQPNKVEDVPDHEIYAALVGIRSSPKRPLVPVALSSLTAAAAVINDDDNEVRKESPPGAFRDTYDRSREIKSSSLALTATNKGFKLLSKMGWKESDGGLGRNRQGSLLPVATTLKGDKKGLGANRPKKARISHQFSSESKRQSETKTQKRRRLRRNETAQQKAKKIRMMLRTDISDEHEALYLNLHP